MGFERPISLGCFVALFQKQYDDTLAFKISNNLVYVNKKKFKWLKEQFSREYHMVCNG